MLSFKYRGLQAPLKGQKEGITDGQGKHRILYTRRSTSLQVSENQFERTFSMREGPKYQTSGICAPDTQRRHT